jgi:PAS domain S-box-containing protein
MKINRLPGKYLFLRILGKPIFFSSLTLLLFTLTVFAAELKEGEPKRVLVIYSYHEGLVWERLIDDSLHATFAAKSNEPIDLNVEHTDRVSYPDDAYLHKLVDLYRRKYSDPKMDLVIGIDDEATEILLRYGEELFPGVPMIFVTAERKDLQRDSLKPNMTSLFWGVDIEGTVELIQKTMPKTRHLFVISGSSLSDQAVNGLARTALEGYTNRLDINYLAEITIEDLLQRVAQLPENSAVIYLAFSRDAEGKSFVPREILSVISEKANAPLFGIVDTYHGQGIVGGSLLSSGVQGKRCAEIGLRILGGESPLDIVSEKTLNVSMFDWRQLKRWSISEDRLPPGSVVQFKELTIWDLHKGRIIGGIALIVLQALIISFLLYQFRIRRRAEQILEERLDFEKMLSELSSEFTSITADRADSKIIDGLSRMGTFMNADRGFLFRFNWDKSEFRITHLWEAEGISKDQTVRGETVRDIFPWLYENLIKSKDIIISDVEELPTLEASCEYEYCRQIGIQSFLILPVQVADAPLCAIGMDSIRIKRKWPMEVQESLRLVGEIFASTIERKHSEERVSAAELKYRTVADYTYDWEYWSNIDGSLDYVSPSCERISGYRVQDFKENPALFREMIVHGDKMSWDTHALESEKELKPGELQFRIQRKDGEIRWIEHVCQPVTDPQGTPMGLRASNRDITARKQAEQDAQSHRAELTHVSRITTLGELSASLAHELNQPLTAILSNAQAARRFLTGDLADPDEVNEILNDIIHDDRRAADMIKRLRALMSKKDLEFTSLDLNKLIQGVAKLVNREAFTKNIALVMDLADGLPQVRGDAIHLEQVVLNLILNGAEAMETLDHQSRELLILTAKHDENAVRVSVRDRGTGIDQANIDGIFKAFYTTKPEGMGMGLSICRSIIEAHGGRLWAENNPDKGATVSFTVPASKD